MTRKTGIDSDKLMDTIAEFLRNGPTWKKVGAVLVAIFVTFGSYLVADARDDISENAASIAAQKAATAQTDVEVQVLGVRVSDVQGQMASLESNLGKLQANLNKARKDLEKVTTLLEDLAKLRDELQEDFNRR